MFLIAHTYSENGKHIPCSVSTCTFSHVLSHMYFLTRSGLVTSPLKFECVDFLEWYIYFVRNLNVFIFWNSIYISIF